MKRRIVQIIASVAVNCAFLLGQPLPGRIYQGALKQVCSPGLNCYACPYAVLACPIGSLQYFIANGFYHFSAYIAGFIALVGTLTGRLACGWVCPFGFVQDLLYRIRVPKVRLPPVFRRLRWLILVGLVIALPLLTDKPAFCRFLCPAGTLEGGLPLPLFNPDIRQAIGRLYFIKIGFLLFFVAGSLFVFRPFCQTACPLGLLYGLFNRVAIFGFEFDPDRCSDCGECAKACPTGLTPQAGDWRSTACIRCRRCQAACPNACFRFGMKNFSG